MEPKRPSLEEEQTELQEIQKLLAKKEVARDESIRVCNSIRIMEVTIMNSIKNRIESEIQKPSVKNHKEEVEELKEE